MIYILLTIVFSGVLYLFFKAFDKYGINNLQAITANYFSCSVLGLLLAGTESADLFSSFNQPWMKFALTLGSMFILLFNLIALTSQRFGVSTASIADKLSFIIVAIAAFLLYQDKVTALKIAGILMAMVAVWLSIDKTNKGEHHHGPLWIPFAVFVGGGVLGALINYVQVNFESLNFNVFLIFLFGTAFIVGLIITVIRILAGKKIFSPKSWLAGFAFGIPNYFSIFYLFQALEKSSLESSVIFPVINIGIVLFTVVSGIIIFKEHLNKKNVLGLFLAIAAILLLMVDQLHGT